ncbi:MAG: cell division protein ZapB [Spirochaetia bacterium]|jgi:FtsZ-binding cell division protein ZapB
MITLEQIRLLEGKITRAIELIRVLKEENSTLRKGLESAQRRMKELETLVDGFKADQKEIESVIVRTLRNLDELEESTAAKRQERGAGGHSAATPGVRAADNPAATPGGIPAATPGVRAADIPAAALPHDPEEQPEKSAPVPEPEGEPQPPEGEPRPPKEELDIF